MVERGGLGDECSLEGTVAPHRRVRAGQHEGEEGLFTYTAGSRKDCYGTCTACTRHGGGQLVLIDRQGAHRHSSTLTSQTPSPAHTLLTVCASELVVAIVRLRDCDIGSVAEGLNSRKAKNSLWAMCRDGVFCQEPGSLE